MFPLTDATGTRPYLGHGVGLRVPHYQHALEHGLPVDWVECISENYFGGGGRPRAVLSRLRRDMPIVFHGVSMGIGSAEGPTDDYLRRLRELSDSFEPAWVSDHLCWTSFGGKHSHDLLPLPYTEEALALVGRNVTRVQERLGRPLVLENVSSYVSYNASRLAEWEFLAELCAQSGCRLLLDLNNVVVSAVNHGFAPEQFIDGLPAQYVWQFHLANHTDHGHYRFDSHQGPVPERVWQLYDYALRKMGRVSSSVEWDEAIPTWDVLLAEQRQAKARAAPGSSPDSLPVAERRSHPGAQGTPAQQNSELRETQALFWRLITHPTGAPAFFREANSAVRVRLEAVFAETPAFTRLQRLDVYAQGYFYRILGCLSDLFPLLRWGLGQAAFHDLVTDYLLAHPSSDPDLSRIGEALPRYLETHATSVDLPALAEFARVERAIRPALDAADELVVSQSALATLAPEDWPRLAFRAPAYAELLPLCYDYEAARSQARAQPERSAGSEDPRLASLAQLLLPTPRQLLVWRREFGVFTRWLADDEAVLLRAAWSGDAFEGLCALALTRGLGPRAVVGYLARWTEQGLLVAHTAPTVVQSSWLRR